MLKITAIVSLMLIVIAYSVLATWTEAASRRHKREGSPSVDWDTGGAWAASLSCDSCGSECAAACGTRHFRSCCFNYLRRKRGPDAVRIPQNFHDFKSEGLQKSKLPVFGVEDFADFWTNTPSDYRFYPFEDTVENRMQAMYDA